MSIQGQIIAVIGYSQSGKTAYVLDQLRRYRRVLVWDPEGQYQGRVVRGPRALLDHIRGLGDKPDVICYRPDRLSQKEFTFFCFAAYTWGLVGERNHDATAIVAEETADVTGPSKAPPGWGELLRRGKKRGMFIYAITQRPAESDKTAIGNADLIHCCRVQLKSDRKNLAELMDVDVALVEGLRADHDQGRFDYIQARPGRGDHVTGTLTFPRNKPRFSNLFTS